MQWWGALTVAAAAAVAVGTMIYAPCMAVRAIKTVMNVVDMVEKVEDLVDAIQGEPPEEEPSPEPSESSKPRTETLMRFLLSIKNHRDLYYFCHYETFGDEGALCDHLRTSQDVRKVTHGYFCPKKGNCVYVRDSRGNTIIRDFIDWWLTGFEDNWVFCDLKGEPCEIMGKSFSRRYYEGIIKIKGTTSDHISAVRVKVENKLGPECLEKPENDTVKPKDDRESKRVAGHRVTEKRDSWALKLSLAYILAILFICVLINCAMSSWQLIILVRKASNEKWLRWQVPSIFICLSLTFVLFVMSVIEDLLGPDLWYIQWAAVGMLAGTTLSMIIMYCIVKFFDKGSRSKRNRLNPERS